MHDDHDARYQAYKRSRTHHPPSRLFKYTTAQGAVSILANGSALFKSPSLFNDPFDSAWDQMWSVRTPAARERQRALVRDFLLGLSEMPHDAGAEFRALFQRLRAEILALPVDERDQRVGKYLDHDPRFDYDPLADESFRDLNRRMRVFCLTEDDASMQMWSHYGDQHRGVLLEFDTAMLQDHWKRPLEPARYVDSMPDPISDHAAVDRCFAFGCPWKPPSDGMAFTLTKGIGWKSEREWRFVWKEEKGVETDQSLHVFPPAAVTKVILGCRCSEDDIARVRYAMSWKYRRAITFHAQRCADALCVRYMQV